MLATTETILFAIKAGLRLYGAMRKAYVDGTRNRKLILPLPRSQGIDWDSAVSFFSDHEDAVKEWNKSGSKIIKELIPDHPLYGESDQK